MKNDRSDFTQGSILKKLALFMLPILGALVLQAAYGAVDLLVVGRFGSTSGLSAVSTGSQVLNLVTFVVTQFAMGITVLIARYLGEKRPQYIGQVIGGAVVFALMAAVLFVALVGFARGISVLMQAPAEALDLTASYVRICGAGIFFIVAYNVLSAIFRGLGDSKSPLLFVLVACIVNVFGDLLLVAGLHLDAAGAAIATVFSQMVSCVLVLTCLCRTEGSYKLSFSKLSMKGYYLKQIFQVGIPAGIQSTVINFSNALLQSSVNSFGSTAMAGYTAANNILGFLYVSINSVTQACMSFTSQNFGVGKYKRMDRVLIDCMILSVGAALVLGCGAYFFGAEILQIYTEEADVIQCGVEILSITTVPYFLCGIMDLFPGALRGMGYSAVPMVLSIIGTVGMRVLWIFAFFPQHRSLYFLFISYPASWIATIVMQVVCYYFVRKHCYK